MNDGSVPEELRNAMAEVRAALSRDARAAACDARTLADWRHHFRNHPWLCCTGAAAIGFLVVPQRKSLPRVAARALGADRAETSRPKSIAATLLEIGGTLVARQSLKYLARRGVDWLEARSATRQAAEQHAPREEGVPR